MIGVVGKQKIKVYYYYYFLWLLYYYYYCCYSDLFSLPELYFLRCLFCVCLYARVLRTIYLLTLFLYWTVRLWSHQINKGKLNWVTIIEIHLPNPTYRNLMKLSKANLCQQLVRVSEDMQTVDTMVTKWKWCEVPETGRGTPDVKNRYSDSDQHSAMYVACREFLSMEISRGRTSAHINRQRNFTVLHLDFSC